MPRLAAAVCITALATQTALAQAALEEIVVTSRKRTETITDAPVAVTAFSAEELQRSGARNLEDLSFRTPGMHFSEQASQIPGRYNTAVRFRGMDTNQTAASQQLGTVFLDGIYVSQGIASLDFSNIERVEVIKGPQSATFGRSTFAGAVNYVTRVPGFERAGRVATEFGEFGTYDVTLSYEAPIRADVLSFRIGGRAYGTDGQYRSMADGGRLGEERTESVSGALHFESGGWSADLRGSYAEDSDGAPEAMYVGGVESNLSAGPNLHNCFAQNPAWATLGIQNYFCGQIDRIIRDGGVDLEDLARSNTEVPEELRPLFADPTGFDFQRGGPFPKIDGVPGMDDIGLARRSLRAGLSLEYTVDGGWLSGHTFQSNTGYNEMRVNWVRDNEFTPAEAWLSQDPQLHEDFSQELRLTSPAGERLRYSIGVNYLDAEFTQQGNGGFAVFDYGPGEFSDADALFQLILSTAAIQTRPYTLLESPFPTEGAQTTGVFGSFGFDLTPKLTLDLEWRWQKDKISQDDRTRPGVEFRDSFESFLPRATLSWQPGESTTLWATYSKGNLPGFFNADLAGLTPAEFAQVQQLIGQASVFNDEEELENHEIGWKQELFDRRLYVAAVLYSMDWTNLKTRRAVPITTDAGGVRVLNLQTNEGVATLRGLELETAFRLSDRFSVEATLDLNDAEYDEFTCAFAAYAPGHSGGRIDCAGKRPPRFPDVTASFAATWQDRLTDSLDYFMRLDGHYFGKAYNEETNFSYIGEFARFNFRAGLVRDGWTVEAFVRNLTDDDSILAASRWSDFSTPRFLGFASQQGVVFTPPERRTFGIRAAVNF